jgi:hypothetical protein
MERNMKIQQANMDAMQMAEARKRTILQKQEEAELRLEEQRQRQKLEEERRKEEVRIKNDLKMINAERKKRKDQYNIEKVKEQLDFDEQRRISFARCKSDFKELRVRNQFQALMQRELIRTALRHMAVWKVWDMDLVKNIVLTQGKGSPNTLEDTIRRKSASVSRQKRFASVAYRGMLLGIFIFADGTSGMSYRQPYMPGSVTARDMTCTPTKGADDESRTNPHTTRYNPAPERPMQQQNKTKGKSKKEADGKDAPDNPTVEEADYPPDADQLEPDHNLPATATEPDPKPEPRAEPESELELEQKHKHKHGAEQDTPRESPPKQSHRVPEIRAEGQSQSPSPGRVPGTEADGKAGAGELEGSINKPEASPEQQMLHEEHEPQDERKEAEGTLGEHLADDMRADKVESSAEKQAAAEIPATAEEGETTAAAKAIQPEDKTVQGVGVANVAETAEAVDPVDRQEESPKPEALQRAEGKEDENYKADFDS